MPTIIKTNFSSGELSPRAYGRVDLRHYRTGVAKMLNYIPTPLGPAMRRSGFYFMGEVKDSDKDVRLLRFRRGRDDSYTIELGDQYMRFWKESNGQQLGNQLVTNGHMEVDANWTSVGTPSQNIRSADYFWGPYYSRRFVPTAINEGIVSDTFSMTTNDDITYQVYVYCVGVTSPKARVTIRAADDGSNEVQQTFVCANDQWTVITGNFTASATGSAAYIQIDSDDQTSGNWYVDHVMVYINDTPTEVATPWDENMIWDVELIHNADIAYAVHPTTPIYKLIRYSDIWWELNQVTIANQPAEWGTSPGYPATGTFHQQRLAVGGVPAYPDWVWLSKSGDPEDFDTGTAEPDEAIAAQLWSEEINLVQWMISARKLLIGTKGNEWIMSGSTGETIKPADKDAKITSVEGGKRLRPVQIGSTPMFVDLSGRTLFETVYDYSTDNYEATNVSMLAEHFTDVNTIDDLDGMVEPWPIAWMVLSDGRLLGLTRMHAEEVIGWHQHTMGGDGLVKSVRCNKGATEDTLWVITERVINGSTKKYIEMMMPSFNDDDTDFGFFVDSGVTTDNRQAITSITKADPGVVTCTGHGYSDGDLVRLRMTGNTIVDDVRDRGMEDPSDSDNNLHFKVVEVNNSDANTFELLDPDSQTDIDTTGFTDFVSGSCAEMVSSVSGLDHLEGEEVVGVGDGSVLPPMTVTAGVVTLQHEASVVHIGYNYISDLKTMSPEVSDPDSGSIQGEQQRMVRAKLRLHKSVGGSFGSDFAEMDDIETISDALPLDQPPPLFSGDTEWLEVEGGYDEYANICVRQDQPYPHTVLAIIARLEVG